MKIRNGFVSNSSSSSYIISVTEEMKKGIPLLGLLVDISAIGESEREIESNIEALFGWDKEDYQPLFEKVVDRLKNGQYCYYISIPYGVDANFEDGIDDFPGIEIVEEFN